MDIFSLLLFAHLAGVILGVGGATVSDFQFFKSIKNSELSADEFKLLKEVSKVIWSGYIIAAVTGIGLLAYQYISTGQISYLGLSYFQAKLFIVTAIGLNGIVFHRKVLPFMKNHLKEDLSGEEFGSRLWLFSVTGTVSIVSWWSVVALAVFNPSMPLALIINLYLLTICFGAAVGYFTLSSVIFNPDSITEIFDRTTNLVLAGTVVLILALTATSGTVSEPDQVFNEKPDIEVEVGDNYFLQQDSDLQRGELEAEAGDVIRFYNDGNIAHTVTIQEFDVDVFLDVGEETFVEVEETDEQQIEVDCTLHGDHQAELRID